MDTKILKMLSIGIKPSVEAVDGKVVISNSQEIFRLFIDENFKKLDLNEIQVRTPKTFFDAAEIVSDTKLQQIFFAVNPDLDKIVMTQHQIVEFCQKNRAWLSQGKCVNFFLIKSKKSIFPKSPNNYFVVIAHCLYNGLSVRVSQFDCNSAWHGNCRHRVIFPYHI